ncbi:MAG: hypothetical protein ACE5HJ_01880 [Thermoplasmata archaeon]
MGRKLRTGIRAAPKVQEKELIRKAKELRSRPEVLVPRCMEESCSRCPFDALLEKLRRVSQVADDEAKLERLSRWGHPLVRAYAGTLLLGVQEKAPYLAPAKTPFGTVHYAHRGKANREKLVGVQYYDVPELRLLTIGDYARKRGLHVYSLKEEMVTTCREDSPPGRFVEESLGRLQISLTQRNGEYVCPHGDADPVLAVEWKGAGMRIVLCRRCIPPKGNLPAFLGSRMIVPQLADCFGVYLRLNMRCHDETCSLAADQTVEGKNAEAYLSGKLGEEELLEKEVDRAISDVASSEGLFVLGAECFERGYEAFLEAVGVPPNVMPAFMELRDELEDGLVIREASTAKLTEALSRDQRFHLLRSLLKDEEMAEALLEAAEAEGRSAEEVLAEALELRRDMEVVSRLPTWESLPPHAALADNVARSYKTQGQKKAILAATKGLQGTSRQKIIALAFLRALGSASGKEWMFRDEEKQLADFLVPMALELMKAEGDAYREALQGLLTASGSGEVLPGK